jgi:uncharacterized protein (DUF1800 family)
MNTPCTPDALTAEESAASAAVALATQPPAAAPAHAARAALVAALSALAACGGGGDAAPGAGTPPPPSPPPPAGPTQTEAARFLAQATLGATDADIAAVMSLGYDGWLTQEFAKPVSTSNWDWLVSKGVYADPNALQLAMYVDQQVWQRLITAPDNLRQRVTLALSEILVVGIDGISGGYKQFKMAAWWDLLCAGAFGSYRTLLEQVTLNPAMGTYLATHGNQKEDPATGRLPDENYAREVLQLFSIGLNDLNLDGSVKTNASGAPVESYTQDAITNLARVFTGWRINAQAGTPEAHARNPMALNAANHSTLAANFLGVTVPANATGDVALTMAMDAIAAHANVGPFIGKQLIQRLVTSNPTPAYVGRVAAVFNNNGSGVRGDLKAVVRAVLLDDEARNAAGLAAPTFGKLREPLVRALAFARSFKATSLSGDWNLGNQSDAATRLGQSPLRSPSVFNYFRPGYVPPNSAIGNAALVAPEFQITHESSVAGYLNTMRNIISNTHNDMRLDYSAEVALAGDPVALLDRVELLLCARQLSAATRSTITTAVTAMASSSSSDKDNRVFATLLLVMASPEYLVQK